MNQKTLFCFVPIVFLVLLSSVHTTSTYAIGEFILGMSSVIDGTYSMDGNPIANRELILMATKTNSTYLESSVIITKTTTDTRGFYSFIVTPGSTGTWYYFLFDSLNGVGKEWAKVSKIDVINIIDSFKPVTDNITNLKQQDQTIQTNLEQLKASNTQLSTNIENLTKQFIDTQNKLVDTQTKLADTQINVTNAFYIGVAGLFSALAVGIIVLMRQRSDG
jgi:cell division protein FtsB